VSGSYLFDEQGNLRDARSLWCKREAIGSIRDLVRCALGNGFIAIDDTAAHVRIRLVPTRVAPVALSAVCYYLADCEAAHIAIVWLDETWHSAHFAARTDAIRHLLCLVPDGRDRAGDFKSEMRSLECLPIASPLGALAQLWHRSRAPIRFDGLSRLLRDGIAGLYVVVQALNDGELYFRDVGWGFPWLEEHWVYRARGLRMRDQPDYLLGSWVTDAYRNAAVSGIARLDDVDAVTVTPQLGRARIRYSRLIVPVDMGGGEHCLLGAAAIDPDIDLRRS
jgi:hypothetical protein